MLPLAPLELEISVRGMQTQALELAALEMETPVQDTQGQERLLVGELVILLQQMALLEELGTAPVVVVVVVKVVLMHVRRPLALPRE